MPPNRVVGNVAVTVAVRTKGGRRDAHRAFRRSHGALLVVALVSSLGASVGAQQNESEAAPRTGTALGRRFGVESLARRLEAPDEAERLRAIRRLSRAGSPRAIDRLAHAALDRRARSSSREWLTLARALAPYASRQEPRLLLSTLLGHAQREGLGPDEAALFEAARAAAALALAAQGSPEALEVLGRALRAPGPAAAAAADALRAHPPAHLEAVLGPSREPSVELARLLGELGDQTAFHVLRDWVRGASTEVRAAAAIALTELGDLETVPLARTWQSDASAELRRAALRIFLLTRAPEAPRALERALEVGLDGSAELALELPSPELLDSALARLERADESSAPWCTWLGRVGGARAATRLAAALLEPPHAFAAAHALSRLRGPEAATALMGALSRPRQAATAFEHARALAVRAAAVRAHREGEPVGGIGAEHTGSSSSARERALAAWLAGLSGGAEAIEQLRSEDALRVRAAAMNALLFDDEVMDAAGGLLAGAPPGPARTALAVALLRPAGRRRVPSDVLYALVSERSAATPLAARVLASREDPDASQLSSTQLAHSDPLLRAHVARGLGDNPAPGAVRALVSRFEFEADASVRLAIVYALAARSERAARSALELAASLDASGPVRDAAALALHGAHLGDAPRGSEFVWLEVRSEGEVGAGEARPASVLLVLAPGLALPVTPDPDGLVVAGGVGAGSVAIRLQ